MNTGGGGRHRHQNQHHQNDQNHQNHQHHQHYGSTGSIGSIGGGGGAGAGAGADGVPLISPFGPPATTSATVSTPTPTPTPTHADFGTPGSTTASLVGGGGRDSVSGSISGSVTGGGASAGQRKERGAIAAQACDTCRSRKQKCDEQRPKCGTCQKFKLACHYREPQPTKKDKTLGEILDRLKTLEGKIDGIGAGTGPRPPSAGMLPDITRGGFGGSSSSGGIDTALLPPPLTPTATSASASAYRYSPAVYQMLGWPAVQQMLAPLAPRLAVHQVHVPALAAEHDALSIILGLHHPAHRLPSDEFTGVNLGMQAVPGMGGVGGVGGMGAGGMGASTTGFYPATPVSLAGSMTLPLGASLGSTLGTSTSLGGPSLLSWDTLYRLSTAYFDSFNYIAPIVDRQTFLGVTLPAALEVGTDATDTTAKTSAGNDANPNIALVLLVAALGDVAIAGVQGAPVLGATGGVKGGTVRHPPGLALFNEARRRMGFVLGDCSLENMQIHALAGIYSSTCLRHMDYWRYTTTASLSCQALITSKPSELSSPRADLIRQIFWYCLIIETHFNIELGLPLTGLDRFEDLVGLPSFSGPYSQDDYLANQASHFQEHFASQIVLRRLCVAFHTTLSLGAALGPDGTSIPKPPTQMQMQMQMPTAASAAASAAAQAAANSLSLPTSIAQMANQLEDWRGMLPPHLRWQELRPADFPNADASTVDLVDNSDPVDEDMAPPSATTASSTTSSTSASVTASMSGAASIPSSATSAPPTATMFSADLDATPVAYPFALDLQVALLRSRYYYTKFLVYKPCLYKAIHHPAQLSHDDAAGAAACLQACLSWPVAMSPTCAHKRLVPCLFFYTQNFLGVLLVLRLAQQLPILQRITATLCGGERFARAARATTALCIAWMRDLRGVDRAAEWAWAVVQALYNVE